MSVANLWILEDCKSHQQIYSDIFYGKFDFEIFPDLMHLDLALNADDVQLPDLLISDIRLPDGNIDTFLKKESRLINDIPCFIVSSLIEANTIESLLDLGVVDYLTKPFQPTELIAKINRFLKARLSQDNLTKKEMKIYQMLISRDKISRSSLEKALWGENKVQVGLLNVHIHNLRKKLKEKNLGIKFSKPNYYQIMQLK